MNRMSQGEVAVQSQVDASDSEQLRLLSVFHYVMAGVLFCFSCFALFYVAFGAVIVAQPQWLDGPQPGGEPPPAAFGYLVMAVGAVLLFLGWTLAAVTFFSGRAIRKRRWRTFSIIVSGALCLICLWMPISAVLGICTLLVLLRPSVRARYLRVAAGYAEDDASHFPAPETMVSPPQPTASDVSNLQMLAMFHYVLGALIILFASIFILHAAFTAVFALAPELLEGPQWAAKIPVLMRVVMGAVSLLVTIFVLLGWALGVLTIYSGRSIATRRNRLLSIIVAGINCGWFPFGTALGIPTLIVLLRPGVRALYGER